MARDQQPPPDVEGEIETRVRTLWSEAFNERELDRLDEMVTPDIRLATVQTTIDVSTSIEAVPRWR